MRAVLVALAISMVALLRSRASLQLEILALRHQLAVLQGGGRRPGLKPADRLLWVWLSRTWSGWQDALVFVKPSTVLSWQRKRFRHHWTRLSRPGRPGRPRIADRERSRPRLVGRAGRPLRAPVGADDRPRRCRPPSDRHFPRSESDPRAGRGNPGGPTYEPGPTSSGSKSAKRNT
jgi:hypothetical protein